MQNNNNIRSSYWKINNSETGINNTFISGLPSNTALSKEADTVAVSFNYADENLRIYQLAANSLIHLASVTLPDIHSLKFLKPVSKPPYDFKFLLSGHSNGIMHLSAIPLTESSTFQNAEIIKRFNHRKALETSHGGGIFQRGPLMLNNGCSPTTITSIDLSSASWTSAPLNSTIVVYDHHLFYWDTTKSSKPVSITIKTGISNAATNKYLNSLTAAVGDFGLSLMDLRTQDSQSNARKYSGVGYSSAHWCTTDENLLATVAAESNELQIWDIRKLQPVATLTEFSGKINDVKWKGKTMWVAQSSGNLSKWNVPFKTVNTTNSESFESSNDNNIAGFEIQISNSNLLSIELMEERPSEDGIVCIDELNLSTHKSNRKKCTAGTEVLQYPNLTIPDFYLSPPKTIDSSTLCDTPVSDRSDIFDIRQTNRRCSDETLPVSTNTGDYLIDFQKEVSQMIGNMDSKTVNNIVYI